MTECDTLFMIGSGFPYAGFMPEEGRARGVQIDIEPDMLSLRYPMEVNLVGDAAEILRLLLPLLKRKQDRKSRGEIEKQVVAWWKLLEERAMQPAKPVNPQRVVWELSPRLPDNAIVTSESGSCANWYARDLKMRRGMMASFSGGLPSMGAAVPYAIAAKFAHPERAVVGLVGDGAMQMNNMAELITVAKYWRERVDPCWVMCVFNNEDLNQVTWEQRVMEGDPKFDASQNMPNVSYHRFAEMMGLRVSTSMILRGWDPRGTRPWRRSARSCSKSRLTRRSHRCHRTSPSTRRRNFHRAWRKASLARERWWPARRANSSAPFCLTIRTSRPRNRASVRPKEGHAHQEKHPKVNAAGEITHVFGHRFVLKTGSKCRCPCRLFWWYRSFGINDEPGPRGAGL
jgi:hypothetical protein